MKKNNNVLGVLVVLLSIVVLVLTIFIVYDKVLNKDVKEENNVNNATNNEVENTDTNAVSATEMLDKIVGNWGRINGMSCYFISISNKDNKYVYHYGEYGTDGGALGDIIEYKAVDSDKIYLKVHFPASVTELGESFERTEDYFINISELSSSVIIVNNKKWELITDTFEDFFNGKIPNRF